MEAEKKAVVASRPRIWNGVARGSSIFPASPSRPPPSAETRGRRRDVLRRVDGGGGSALEPPNGAAWPRDGKDDATADIIALL